jgi:hypothetical protein
VLLSSGGAGLSALRLDEPALVRRLALHPTRRAPLARGDLPSEVSSGRNLFGGLWFL